jgi:hypothetical protein
LEEEDEHASEERGLYEPVEEDLLESQPIRPVNVK